MLRYIRCLKHLPSVQTGSVPGSDENVERRVPDE